MAAILKAAKMTGAGTGTVHRIARELRAAELPDAAD
jgi:hypothetical protein